MLPAMDKQEASGRDPLWLSILSLCPALFVGKVAFTAALVSCPPKPSGP